MAVGMDIVEPVNLSKSILVCNFFHFFFSASKSVLMPFLTLYFRFLGMTATEAGYIMGAKTLSSLIFAPLWAKCATQSNKRRFVLMFSIFMLAVTYLSLTLVPSISQEANEELCSDGNTLNHSALLTHIKVTNLIEQSKMKNRNESFTKGEKLSTKSPIPLSNAVTFSTVKTPFSNVVLNNTNITHQSLPIVVTQKPNEVTNLPVIATESRKPDKILTTPASDMDDVALKNTLQTILHEVGVPLEDINSMDIYSMIDILLALIDEPAGIKVLLNYIPLDQVDEFRELLEGLLKQKEGERVRRDLSESWKTLKEKLLAFRDEIKAAKYHMFVIVLVVLIVGELFSSPVEKVSDDAWFEFLETIDDLEKYGKHRIWCSIAYILFPLITTVIVDNTDCLFGLKINHFMVHFYMFGALLGITFLFGFFFPMSNSVKQKYVSKVGRGLRIVCCNFCNFMYVITILLMGTAYATYNNYLFWRLEELGSKEITMGMCIMIATLSEIPMLFFSDKLVKTMGNAGVASISLICLSVRVLIYSFITSPWVVLPAELTHAFTHTALWWAVLSQPAFNVSPFVSRSIRSILSSLYFGFGFAIGSMVSGFVYDTYGGQILFRSTSIIIAAWVPLFVIVQRCFRHDSSGRVKYTRLLQGDDANDDELEDDWLEEALKEH